MHRRIALKFEYIGTSFSGSQMQADTRTVQSELERALACFFRFPENIFRPIKIIMSGRTDSGVHALGQVAHFDIEFSAWLRAFPESDEDLFLNNHNLSDNYFWRLCWGLNGILATMSPKAHEADIAVIAAQFVPLDFSARYSALRRCYLYRILNRTQKSVFAHNSKIFIPEPLNLELMKLASTQLLGTHDFVSFKSSNKDESTTVCEVESVELLNLGEGELEFWISANHFVYNMVRIIVGTLIEIGLAKRSPHELKRALLGKSRQLAGPTAPPWGLYLHSVEYPSELCLFQTNVSSEKIKERPCSKAGE